MASRESKLLLGGLLLGTLLFCCLGAAGLGYLGHRGFALGYTPRGMRVETRGGRALWVHPSLGFTLLYPGPSFVRDEVTETRQMDATPLPIELIVHRDEGAQLDLQIIAQSLPIVNTSSARSALESFLSEVGTPFHHEVIEHGPHHFEGAAWLRLDDGVPMHLRMHTFEREGKGYAVFLAASGFAPEELEPVLQSFRLPEGQASERFTLRRAREELAPELLPVAVSDGTPAPPPAAPFSAVQVQGPVGALSAYVMDDPGDGARHPALLWLHGGFGTIGPRCWDGYPRAFSERGIVVMCSSTRGEVDNPGGFELMLGEVDDARAAFEYLRALPYVDPARVYVAGHSVGGTLTLLLAESTDGIRGAFSFGGAPDLASVVEDGEGYGNTPYDYRDRWQSYVRSPLSFVWDLRAPTHFFEGAQGTTTREVLDAMERGARRGGRVLRSFLLEGHDHWSAVPALVDLVARRIEADVSAEAAIEIGPKDVAAALAAAGPGER